MAPAAAPAAAARVDPEGIARGYQMEILALAKEQNTIAYLETGCGKTLIAVLLLRSRAHALRRQGDKKLAVFIVPKVCLVTQQADVIGMHTDFVIGRYFGAMGIDYWDRAMWLNEFQEKEVLVLTAQILLNVLEAGFLKMQTIDLLIIDECHHAQKKHPYASIMQIFYHPLKQQGGSCPIIFGMTASPVVQKGVKTARDCAKQLCELEALLDAQVQRPRDKQEIDSYVPTPNQKIYYFKPPIPDKYKHLEELLDQQRVRCLAKILENCNTLLQQTSESEADSWIEEEVNVMCKHLSRGINLLHSQLIFCLEELGLWCAVEACSALSRESRGDVDAYKHHLVRRHHDQLVILRADYLKGAAKLLSGTLPAGKQKKFMNKAQAFEEEVELGIISSKVKALIQYLSSCRLSSWPLPGPSSTIRKSCNLLTPTLWSNLVGSRIVLSLEHVAHQQLALVAGGQPCQEDTRAWDTSDLDKAVYQPQQQIGGCIHLLEYDLIASSNILLLINVMKDCQSGSSLLLATASANTLTVLHKDGAFGRTESAMCCIVFVERLVVAEVLSKLLNRIECLASLRCTYITGQSAMSQKHQQRAIDGFRKGEIDLLVSTDVSEEGVDIAACQAVVRFDLPKTVRGQIQSRGRARRPGSDYIILLASGAAQDLEHLRLLQQSEETMRTEAVDRTKGSDESSDPSTEDGFEEYRVESTGALLTTRTAVSRLHLYCDKLAHDKYYLSRPHFRLEEVGDMHVCTVRLPLNAPFPMLRGQQRSCKETAKQSVCLEACKRLHQLGAMSDHLVPVLDTMEIGEEGHSIGSTKKKTKTSGMSRRQIITAPCAIPRALCKNDSIDMAITQQASTTLMYVYSLDYKRLQGRRDELHDKWQGLVLLTVNVLQEVGDRMNLELCLHGRRRAQATLAACGTVQMSATELREAMEFHSKVFGYLLSKSQDGRINGFGAAATAALLQGPDMEAWKLPRFYLILPAQLRANSKPAAVDWENLRRVLAWAQQRKTRQQTEGMPLTSSSCPRASDTAVVAPGSTALIMAGGQVVSKDSLIDMSVVSLHTGLHYHLLGVQERMCADSPFPNEDIKGDKEGKKSYTSFTHYFLEKYNIPLHNPKQALLRVCLFRKINNNLLSPSILKAGPGSDASLHGCQLLPPELCEPTGLSACLIRAAQFLPSVMNRVEGLLVAGHLLARIRGELEARAICTEELNISVDRVLEALTTGKCQEVFSLERLELMGDAFLKYSVSLALFTKHTLWQEGQLSKRRTAQICNSNLCRLALLKKLEEYIRADKFIISDWLYPGMSFGKCSHHAPVADGNLDKEDALRVSKVETESLEDQHKLKAPKSVEVLPNEMLQPAINESEQDVKEAAQKQGQGNAGEHGALLVAEKLMQENELPFERCDLGCRPITEKAIADSVEALLAAFLVEGGTGAALKFLTWLGMDDELCELNELTGKLAREAEALDDRLDPASCDVDLSRLEADLGYTFSRKTLLLEALTHASHFDLNRESQSYQRLEFLGDALLDYMITDKLFVLHANADPGMLTDLRSESVNNEHFAVIACKAPLELHKRLRHRSASLLRQITIFIQSLRTGDDIDQFGCEDMAPKVLGDLLESLAGAVFVDTGYDMAATWRIFEPLITPLPTPDTVQLQANRALQELCQRNGLKLEYVLRTRDGEPGVDVDVVIEGSVLTSAGHDQSRTTARKLAAVRAFNMLKAALSTRPPGSTKSKLRTASGDQLQQPLTTEFIDKLLRFKPEEVAGSANACFSIRPPAPKTSDSSTGRCHADQLARICRLIAAHSNLGIPSKEADASSNVVPAQIGHLKKDLAPDCVKAKDSSPDQLGAYLNAMRDHMSQNALDLQSEEGRKTEGTRTCHLDSKSTIQEASAEWNLLAAVSEKTLDPITRRDTAALQFQDASSPSGRRAVDDHVQVLEPSTCEIPSAEIVNEALLKPSSLPTGQARTLLYEACSKRKWVISYKHASTGPPHSPVFRATATICMGELGTRCSSGVAMPTKKLASDSAAVLLLEQLALG
eukprot:SM000277S10343  [mRNA]  locus=s277:85413:96633:- [translate_table: standard]